MKLPHEELALKEYETLQAEKRDRMQARLQIWSVVIGLIGAFGLASLQAGPISWVLALYPLLAACIARYSGHNEAVLTKIKRYLLTFEQTHGYRGYEQYNLEIRHKQSGSQTKALRDALLVTAMLATLVVSIRLLLGSLMIVAIFVMLV